MSITLAPRRADFCIIIPTLNEAGHIEDNLRALINRLDADHKVDILISDGGSSDKTVVLAQIFPLSVIHSPRGRAAQMNSAARATRANWLIFLHADSCLPTGWMSAIECSDKLWGRFDVTLDGRHWLFRFIEKAINLRSCVSSVATGDQAMFFRADFFRQLGGFPDIPLMEDIAISKLARRHQRAACLQPAVITSARRWQKNGILRTILLMWLLRLAYWFGINPEQLHRIYYK